VSFIKQRNGKIEVMIPDVTNIAAKAL